MQEADADKYLSFPESIRVVAVTGDYPDQEIFGVGDGPAYDDSNFQEYVRYVRFDESDLFGFVPQHWQEDAQAWKNIAMFRTEQALCSVEELQAALDANSKSTRDRLQWVRALVAKQHETWTGRQSINLKNLVDGDEDMI